MTVGGGNKKSLPDLEGCLKDCFATLAMTRAQYYSEPILRWNSFLRPVGLAAALGVDFTSALECAVGVTLGVVVPAAGLISASETFVVSPASFASLTALTRF